MSMILAPVLLASMQRFGIHHAARFDGTTGYMSRTPATASNRKTGTFSAWVRRAERASYQTVACWNTSEYIRFNISDQVEVGVSGGSVGLVTSAVFRDRSAWMHIVAVFDTTQATASERIRLWINGVRMTSFASASYPALNSDLPHVNNATPIEIGRFFGAAQYANACMANVHWVDGLALDPSSFGHMDVDTANWTAKAYAGNYGTNGYFLNFSIYGAPNADASGNGNHFAVSGAVTQVADTPTDVECIWNPDSHGNASFTAGNTAVYLDAVNDWAVGTFPFDAADNTYVEVEAIAFSGASEVGISISGGQTHGTAVNNAASCSYHSGGSRRIYGTYLAYGAAWGLNDKIGIHVNAGTLTFYKNGVSQGTAATTLGGMFTVFAVQNSSSSYALSRVLVRPADWSWAGPEGARALTTSSLPVVSDTVSNHFTATLWTAPSSADGSFNTGLADANFIWMKSRGATAGGGGAYHHLFDNCRGMGKVVYANATNAEFDSGVSWVTENAGVVTIPASSQLSVDTESYVAWCVTLPVAKYSGWGGTPTITPTKEMCDQTLGMSVVAYTGNGVPGATIPHTLGKKPGFILIKNLDNGTQHWAVYHKGIGASYGLRFNDASAQFSDDAWNYTEPTDEVISLGGAYRVNQSGCRFVAYVFAETDFLKIGSYKGNGSADGPCLTTGASPVFWMTKRIDAADEWFIMDSARDLYNPRTRYVRANSTAAEATGLTHDFVSTGVKIRHNGISTNANAGTYVYMMIGQPLSPSENTAR